MKEILTFHVRLAEITPVVWRRFELRAEGTFWHLHCVLQDVMPWQDTHLHEFEFPTGDKEVRIGIPMPEAEVVGDPEMLAGWETPLLDWFDLTPSRCVYLYDFGDTWQHHLTLESRRPAERGVRYPRCTAGERQCPPEDVGGPRRYVEFLEAMSGRRSQRRREYEEWIGGSSTPSTFGRRRWCSRGLPRGCAAQDCEGGMPTGSEMNAAILDKWAA